MVKCTKYIYIFMKISPINGITFYIIALNYYIFKFNLYMDFYS